MVLDKTFLPMWPPPRTLALLLWIWDFISLIRSWRKERTAFSQIFHQAWIKNSRFFRFGGTKMSGNSPESKNVKKSNNVNIPKISENVWKFPWCQYTKMPSQEIYRILNIWKKHRHQRENFLTFLSENCLTFSYYKFLKFLNLSQTFWYLDTVGIFRHFLTFLKR